MRQSVGSRVLVRSMLLLMWAAGALQVCTAQQTAAQAPASRSFACLQSPHGGPDL